LNEAGFSSSARQTQSGPSKRTKLFKGFPDHFLSRSKHFLSPIGMAAQLETTDHPEEPKTGSQIIEQMN